MPVARIITHLSEESAALKALCEQLRAGGYEVEVAPPGTEGAASELVVELEELSAAEALDSVLRLAREADADVDVFIAPGLFPQPAMGAQAEHIQAPHHSEFSITPETRSERSQPPAVDHANSPDIRIEVEEKGIIGSALEDLGSALSEGRMGIGDAVSSLQARAGNAWARWQQQRAEAAQALRLARERREMEREERRRQHEAELQRRAEEHQQLLAERERLAAEQERVLREQMARDAALRAERERAEREAAQEAARRAAAVRAQEQERLAAIQAERVRAQREQEERRAAALAAERSRLQREEAERIRRQREEEARAAASAAREPAPPAPAEIPARPRPAVNYVPEPVYADTAPEFRRMPLRPPRRLPSRREQQWQRAALLASIVTLAAMLGFGLAANLHRSSPIPASLIQNEAQQQVPFGPAKMDLTSAGKPAVSSPASGQGVAARGGQAASRAVPRATTSQKPSPAKPAPQRRGQRVSRESNLVAEDEVIVRHIPTRTQRAQSSSGVRRITDEN